jgi:beta-glucanase (GH16 family)
VPAWHDEFDGPDVDATKWRVADENPTMDLPYRRNWMPKNVTIEDGALVITTHEESDGSFSTGAVRTGYYVPADEWEFGQAFGRFEARIQAPAQQGHWAAFWLYTPDVGTVNGDGRDGTEIDIVEFAYVQSDRVNHALHWDGYDADHQSSGEQATGFGVYDGGWHTFTLEWYPDEYVFYVDGTETWRTTDGGVSQVPQYIKLTEEIGHYGTGPDQWGSGPIEDATLPDTTRFDYVRVWAYEP